MPASPGPLSLSLGELRQIAGLTQAQVAEATGHVQQWISDIEHRPVDTLSIRVLDNYLQGIGMQLRLVAVFEDGTQCDLA